MTPWSRVSDSNINSFTSFDVPAPAFYLTGASQSGRSMILVLFAVNLSPSSSSLSCRQDNEMFLFTRRPGRRYRFSRWFRFKKFFVASPRVTRGKQKTLNNRFSSDKMEFKYFESFPRILLLSSKQTLRERKNEEKLDVNPPTSSQIQWANSRITRVHTLARK